MYTPRFRATRICLLIVFALFFGCSGDDERRYDDDDTDTSGDDVGTGDVDRDTLIPDADEDTDNTDVEGPDASDAVDSGDDVSDSGSDTADSGDDTNDASGDSGGDVGDTIDTGGDVIDSGDSGDIGGDATDSGDTGPDDGAVEFCRDLPATTNRCDVDSGSGGALLIQGDVMGYDTVYQGGAVLVEDDIITCVGCDCLSELAAATATVITCPGEAISPGLVNAHDHLGWTHQYPATWGTERYEHRHDWRRGARGHSRVSPGNSGNTANRAWGELRQLMSGTTSIAGSGSADGFLRNLDSGSRQGGDRQRRP